MQISKELAIKILKYQNQHEDFYFPFQVIRKGVADEDDFMEIEPCQWKLIKNADKFEKFELRENLQNLSEETVELMAKGFIEKILNFKSKKRFYILLTTADCQFPPNFESDIANYQVLGCGKGRTAKEAVKHFKKENSWFKNLESKKIIGAELTD